MVARTKKIKKLVQEPKTAGYQPSYYGQWFQRPRDLPPFNFTIIQTMLMDPTVRLGLAIRSAVIQGAEFAYSKTDSSGEKWIPGVQADDPVIAAFVLRQLKHIWQHHLDALLSSQIWGWSACEVTYKFTRHGTVEIDRLLPSQARDVKALVGQDASVVAGVRFLRIRGEDIGNGTVDLVKPKCIWHAFMPESRQPYGVSVLFGAYSPWADKWLNGGALDVRRLFMKKDAYGGVDIAYPDESYTLPNNEVVYARDVARQMAEQLMAGGVTTRPSSLDQNGKERFTITRATVPANPAHILQYPKDLDVELLRGMEIPDDVLTSEDTGAWAGKQVPLAAFYQGLERWLRGMVSNCVDIVQFLVDINFGEGRWFEVTTKPLMKQAMDAQKQSSGDSGSGQAQPQQQLMQPRQEAPSSPEVQRLSLQEQVGQGSLSAFDVVKEARKRMGDRLRGGKADSKSPDEFNTDDLMEGMRHEMEHTNDPTLALEIAMDHLAEDKDYYRKWKAVEK